MSSVVRNRAVPTLKPQLFEILTEEYRSLPLPGVGPKAKLGECFVRVTDLPNFDEWLDVNPRVPKRNAKEVLTGPTVAGIRNTLLEAPQDMILKNLGIYLLVDSAEHERRQTGGNVLRVSMSDPNRHGLANGGHTYAVIRDTVENPEMADLSQAYVRLHVFQGIPEDKVSQMAEGLNRSRQVDDPSLMNLGGLFDSIKSAMKGKTGCDKISYRQGEAGEVYVTEVLMALELFNCERFDRERHPYGLYRYQKKMLEMFTHDSQPESGNPMNVLIQRLPEILVLADQIRKEVPAAARKCCNFELGRMKPDPKKKVRAGSEKHKNTPLHFLGETMDYRIPNGWLYPMLAAFRANVEWDLKKKVFDWKIPLDELLPAVIGDLVRVCVTEHRDNQEKPEDVGVKASVYSQCFDKVELYLLRRAV